MATTLTMIMASLPLQEAGESEGDLLAKLQQQLGKIEAAVCKLNLPDIPALSSDTLWKLIDEITSVLPTMEELRNKVLSNIKRSDPPSEASNSNPLEMALCYAQQFEWDAKLYPVKSSTDTEKVVPKVAAIVGDNLKLLQEKLHSLRSVRSKIQALVESTRCMMTGDLRLMMKPEDVVRSEHMRTVAVAVPLSKEETFTKTYESFHTNVMKKSDRVLGTDERHTLHKVVLLSDAVPTFTAKAKELGCTVRLFDATPEEHQSKRNELKTLVQKKDTEEEDLHDWCRKREHEVQKQRYHLLTLRQAAENRQFYGARIKFMPVVVCVPPGHEKKTRSILKDVPRTSGGLVLTPDEETLYSSLFPEDELDNVPYVSYKFES